MTDEEKAGLMTPDLTASDLQDHPSSYYELDDNERRVKEEHLENVILQYRQKKEQRLDREDNDLAHGEEGMDVDPHPIDNESVVAPNLEIVPHITYNILFFTFRVKISLPFISQERSFNL